MLYPIRNFELPSRMNKLSFECISYSKKTQIRIKILQVINVCEKVPERLVDIKYQDFICALKRTNTTTSIQPYIYIFKMRKLFAKVIQMENAKLFANYIPKGNFYFTSFTLTCGKCQQQTKY